MGKPQTDGDRAPARRNLYISTVGVDLGSGMVNLNHLLVEAVLDGLVGPGDRLAVRQVPWLSHISEPPAALRVGRDLGRPDRWRAFAALTKETTFEGDPVDRPHP